MISSIGIPYLHLLTVAKPTRPKRLKSSMKATSSLVKLLVLPCLLFAKTSLVTPVTGKQLIYHALQEPTEAIGLNDLAAMDKDIAMLREAVTAIKTNEKLLRANLSAVNATQSIGDLRKNVQTIEQERMETLNRLGSLRQGNVRRVLPQERQAVDDEWRGWKGRAGRRQKIGIELWEMCTEELPESRTKAEIWVRISAMSRHLTC